MSDGKARPDPRRQLAGRAHRERLDPPGPGPACVEGRRPRRRGRIAVALALAAVVLAPLAASAEECPYPLGDFVVVGDFNTYGDPALDPERQIVDAVRVRPQYSFGQVGYDGTTLHLVYESETSYLRNDTNVTAEAHIIAYKQYSAARGWNTTRLYPSSDNVSVKLSEGGHTQPTMAVASGGVWLAWQVAGWINGSAMWPQDGTYILLRGLVDGNWTERMELSPFFPVSTNRLPKAIAVGTSAYFAYQTNAGQNNGTDFRIVGRMWDGHTLGPVENISAGAAGRSDETVQLASFDGRVAAVWTSRDLSDLVLEGNASVHLAVREPDGTWSAEQTVSSPQRAAAENPAVAFGGDGVLVVWSTNDPTLGSPTQRDVVLREVSAAGGPGPTLVVSAPDPRGEMIHPAVTLFGGRVHLMWVRIPPTPIVQPTSTDLYYRTWNGTAFGDVVLVSDTVDKGFDESWPGFFTVGGALHAFYISDVNTPATGKPHDNREMTRLLERGPRPQDSLNATLRLESHAFLGSGSVNATVAFFGAGGSLAPSDHYAIKLADGTAVRLPPGVASFRVQLPYSQNSLEMPQAMWCGKPVPLLEVSDPPERPPSTTPWFSIAVGAGIGAAALVGAAAWVAHRRRRPGSP